MLCFFSEEYSDADLFKQRKRVLKDSQEGYVVSDVPTPPKTSPASQHVVAQEEDYMNLAIGTPTTQRNSRPKEK